MRALQLDGLGRDRAHAEWVTLEPPKGEGTFLSRVFGLQPPADFQPKVHVRVMCTAGPGRDFSDV